MALIPSVLILFDTTALTAGKTLEWQEFSRLGECYLPEGVLQQMDYLCDRGSEPELESTVREFMRFYPTSGWKKTSLQAEHPNLKSAPGHTLSKRARLSLEVASCAYGVALRYPERLIVLIANDQSLLQQVMGLKLKNLCGLPLPALLQWARSQRRPPVVTQHLQSLRTSGQPEPSTRRSPAASAKAVNTASRSAAATPTDPTPAVRPGMYTAKRQRVKVRSRQFFSLVSNLVSLVIFLIVLAAFWRFVSPGSFEQFWNRLPVVGGPR
jgi:hypothetical protein